MTLDHQNLEPFSPVLKSLLRTAFRSGLDRLQSDGFKLADIRTNERARRRFMRACHYGYGKAQVQIAEHLIDLREQIQSCENEVKRLRATHDLSGRSLIPLLRVLKSRELVLRRIVDGILFTIVASETWVLRHLRLNNQISPLDPVVLKRTIGYATKLNEQDRSRFYLVSDLTTVVQIGDLVEQDLHTSKHRKWRVIELKSGRMNEILIEKLGNREQLSSDEESEIEALYGKAAKTQARRIVRQSQRESNLRRVLETDRGFVAGTSTEMLVTPEMFHADTYFDAIWELFDRATSNGQAAVTIDGSLRLVAMRQDVFSREGGLSAIAHLFYHIRQNAPPVISVGSGTHGIEEVAEELKAIAREPQFVDVVAQNLHAQWGRPLTMEPIDRVPDLIMGRIRIFAQFDLEAFVERIASSIAGVTVSVERKVEKEAAKLGVLTYDLPCTRGVRAVKVTFANGDVMTYGSGFFGRILNDFTTPCELIEMIRRDPEQMQKAIDRHTECNIKTGSPK